MSPEQIIAYLSGIVALITVVVSVFTLANTARKDAFDQLQKVVQELKDQLGHAREDLRKAHEENNRLRAEIAEREERMESMVQRIDAQDALIAALQAQIHKGT